MCLITLRWSADENQLSLIANRDEFRDRPTAAAQHWDGWWGGRDRQAGGTWLAVGQGRLAAVTNVREPGGYIGNRSRGELPLDFLFSNQSSEEFAQSLDGFEYSGFNLLVFDGQSLWFTSNRHPAQALASGVHGLSNAGLNTPWPKLVATKAAMESSFELGVEAMSNTATFADDSLPKTGVSLEWERLLSAAMIDGERYGTRSQTQIQFRNGQFDCLERRFDQGAVLMGESRGLVD